MSSKEIIGPWTVIALGVVAVGAVVVYEVVIKPIIAVDTEVAGFWGWLTKL